MGPYYLPRFTESRVFYKLVTAFLFVAFSFSPFTSYTVVAQEDIENPPLIQPIDEQGDIDIIAPALPETSVETLADIDPVLTEEGFEDRISPTESEAQTLQGVAASSEGEVPVNIKKDVSNTSFLNTKVDPKTGAFTFDLPLTTPPGRNGMDVDLSLNYSSRSQETFEYIAKGWNISIPYIERMNKTGVNNLYKGEQSFYSSLEGELVPTSNSLEGWYYPKLQEDSYLTYVYGSDKWTVRDNKGNQYIFGLTSNSRIYDPEDRSHTYRWYLEDVIDMNGNYVRYHYFHNTNQVYLNSIRYTGFNNDTGSFRVDFSWTNKAKSVPTYISGFSVETRYRLSSVSMYANSEMVRQYHLTYGLGDNNEDSLLTSVVEQARKEYASSLIQKPPYIFTYSTSSPVWIEDSNLGSPETLNALDSRVTDINGDSLPDIIRSKGQSGEFSSTVWINDKGTLWNQDPSWVAPLTFSYWSKSKEVDEGVRLADVNGDGLVDIIRAKEGITPKVYINKGNSWEDDPSWIFPENFIAGVHKYDAGTRLVDINGDGLIDIVRGFWDKYYTLPEVIVKKVYLNNGNGWTLDPAWEVPVYFSNQNTDTGARLTDVNGDSLTDIVTLDSVYINTGIAWVKDATYIVPVSTSDAGVRIFDINQDGLDDIINSWEMYDLHQGGIYHTVNNVYINSRSGWTLDPEWKAPVPFHRNGQATGMYIGDVNGDKSLDILAQNSYSGMEGSWDFNLTYAGPKQNNTVNTLTSVMYPQGGSIEVEYQSSFEYKDASDTSLNTKLPQSVMTVKKILFSDGITEPYSLSYIYEGGQVYYKNALDRQFAGFSVVTETDSYGNYNKTYFHQGDSANTSLGESQDAKSKIGKVYRVEEYSSNDELYKVTIHTWVSKTSNIENLFTLLHTYTVTLHYDGNSSHKDTAIEYTYGSYLNISSVKEYGEVTASNNGSFTDIGNDLRTTLYEYQPSGNQFLAGLITKETVKNKNLHTLKESLYYYDNEVYGKIKKGNITKIEKKVSDNTYVDIEKKYNTYGLVETIIDERDKLTTFTYDPLNIYVAKTVNPLNQELTYIYDYSLGNVLSVTDHNGNKIEYILDAFDRVLEERTLDPLSSSKKVIIKTDYQYDDNRFGSVIRRDYIQNSSNSRLTYSYKDGFDRIIQIRKELPGTNSYSVTDTIYTPYNTSYKVSFPYTSLGIARTAPTTDPSLITEYTYDPLKRIKTASDSIGTEKYTYDDWSITIQDKKGIQREYTYDAFNNLAQVTEENKGSTYTTRYMWDALGNLISLIDSRGNVRSFTYDMIGRRLTAEDLHSPIDYSFGIWIYSYDGAGNLIKRIDPKKQQVVWKYDDLNRVTSEDFLSAQGVEVAYEYDTCPWGKGYVCAVNTPNVKKKYEYDFLGNVRLEESIIDGTSYKTSYTYTRQGDIFKIIYPDETLVEYLYDTAGYVATVRKKEKGQTSFVNLLTGIQRIPTGSISREKYANKVISNYTYDSSRNYALTSKQTFLSSSVPLQKLAYSYDSVGNITRIQDLEKITYYTYDDLSRLIHASTQGTSTPQTSTEYSIRLTVNKSKVQGSVKNFPLYVDLATFPATFWSKVKQDGGDIRVWLSDQKTQAPFELTGFNLGLRRGGVYFKAPYLSSTTTSIFYISYGNETRSKIAATDTYGRNNVWDEYEMVFHFDEIEQGIVDSAGKQDVTSNGNVKNIQEGKIQGAFTFDGEEDFINTKWLLSNIGEKDLTVQAFVKPATSTYMSISETVYGGNQALYFGKNNANTFYFLLIGGQQGGMSPISTTVATTSSWYLLHGQRNQYTQNLFVNGSNEKSNSVIRLPINGTMPLYIGAQNDPSGALNDYEGSIDEYRVRLSALSPDWITTESNNILSPKTFFSLSVRGLFNSTSEPVTGLTHSYTSIGNIQSSSDTGNYLYEGDKGSNFANPHAVTAIQKGTVKHTFIYDKNGNLIKRSDGLALSWDYQNRLTSSTFASSTSSYTYDASGNRIKMSTGSSTTIYPNDFFTVTPHTTTKYIYLADRLIATVDKTASTTSTYYVHADHLGSTDVVTNNNGQIVENIEYDPFGSVKVDSGARNEQRKYIGQEYDEGTDLSYLNARYYDGARGQFISQDPVFWEIGQSKEGIGALSDPQSMNSYSYAGNNPIRNSDPDGRWYKEILTGQQSWSSFYGEVGEATQYMGSGWQTAMDHPVAAGAAVGVGSGLAAYGASAALTSLSVNTLSGIGTRSIGNLSKLDALPQVSTVPGKLGQLSEQLGKPTSQILQDVAKSGKPYIDFRNRGNINILSKIGSEKMIRITTDPTISRIISAGRMETSQVTNLIKSGNMQSLKSSLSGLSKALSKLISK